MNTGMNSEWLTCVEATRGDKRHVSQATDPTGVIVASKSMDDGVIENDDVDVRSRLSADTRLFYRR